MLGEAQCLAERAAVEARALRENAGKEPSRNRVSSLLHDFDRNAPQNIIRDSVILTILGPWPPSLLNKLSRQHLFQCPIQFFDNFYLFSFKLSRWKEGHSHTIWHRQMPKEAATRRLTQATIADNIQVTRMSNVECRRQK